MQEKMTGAKPEDKTLLCGSELVDKRHPQIAFRGKLDSLVAAIVKTQITADEQENKPVSEDLEGLLVFVRRLQRVEVTGDPVGEITLLGLSSAELRHDSQQVKEAFGIDHPVPSRKMGRLCAELNLLRTQVRETELRALHAFAEGQRPDIIEGLNRLSSAVYIVLCRELSGWYGTKHPEKEAPAVQDDLAEKLTALWQEIGESAEMVLSTSWKDRVTSRTVNVVRIGDAFYFQTDRMMRKYEQLANNPRAALCKGDLQLEGSCREIGHPLENPAFSGVYQIHFPESFERYSFVQEERVFEFRPDFVQRWLYLDGIPHIERFDLEKNVYILEDYDG